MSLYKCKRDIWEKHVNEEYPDFLSFKKNNIYILEDTKLKTWHTRDEEGRRIVIKDLNDEWFQKHFNEV